MIIGELLWTLFLIGFGVCLGWSIREWQAEKASRMAHEHHMGLYTDPHLSHWFRLRAMETDPFWASMPLREYARRKKAQAPELSP